MPAKNAIKNYIKNGYYHLYNRGVEKREIFLDMQDYSVFLSYLKEYLLPKEEKNLNDILSNSKSTLSQKDKALKSLRMNNFSAEIRLLAYCLMPNHFHMFVQQNKLNTINTFMRSLGTRYTMYFNKKYKRVGTLYQSVYKAVLVTNEAQFLHLSRYIHKQALIPQGESLQEKQPCSYLEYINLRHTKWIHPEDVLSYFSKTNPSLSYASFVKQQEDPIVLKGIVLEE